MNNSHEIQKIEDLVEILNGIVQKYPKHAEYAYTHSIIELIKSNGAHIEQLLRHILEEQQRQLPASDLAKIALYALCYYYKRYTKNDSLEAIFENYQELLCIHPLKNEILSWYFRNIGDYERAYMIDKAFCEDQSLREINVVQYISFGSSVAYLLEAEANEKSYVFWESASQRMEDWTAAIKAMDDVMLMYARIKPGKKYAKHYTVLGRLYLYAPEVSVNINNAHLMLDKADACFRNALQYEDVNSKDYIRRCGDIQRYQGKIELTYMKIRFKSSIDEQEKKFLAITEEIEKNHEKRILTMEEEYEHKRQEMKKQYENEVANLEKNYRDKIDDIDEKYKKDSDAQQNKSIEVITIFTAVIAIILGSVDIMGSFSFTTGTIFITLIGLVCCELVCVLCIILDDGDRFKRAIWISILLLIPIVLVFAVVILQRLGIINL